MELGTPGDVPRRDSIARGGRVPLIARSQGERSQTFECLEATFADDGRRVPREGVDRASFGCRSTSPFLWQRAPQESRTCGPAPLSLWSWGHKPVTNISHTQSCSDYYDIDGYGKKPTVKSDATEEQPQAFDSRSRQSLRACLRQNSAWPASSLITSNRYF